MDKSDKSNQSNEVIEIKFSPYGKVVRQKTDYYAGHAGTEYRQGNICAACNHGAGADHFVQ